MIREYYEFYDYKDNNKFIITKYLDYQNLYFSDEEQQDQKSDTQNTQNIESENQDEISNTENTENTSQPARDPKTLFPGVALIFLLGKGAELVGVGEIID